MQQFTIPAQVVNGHLHHDANLAELEGLRVIATLTVVPKNADNGREEPPQLEDAPEFDPDPPTWLDVENDVYFPISVPDKLLEMKPLITERGTPSIILPEELPDQ
jgi:hypothetical protein